MDVIQRRGVPENVSRIAFRDVDIETVFGNGRPTLFWRFWKSEARVPKTVVIETESRSRMRFGYAWVSTEEQRLDRQVDALEEAGCERIFLEKASGAKASRPELEKLLSALRDGDEVVVVKLDRISRSTRHLIELTERFDEMGVDFISLNDSIDTTTPMGRFFFRIMASIAELERDMIVERTKDGLSAARARGHGGGRPKAPAEAVSKARRMHESGAFSVSEITEATGISKSTLYRSLAREAGEPPSGVTGTVQCASANRRKDGSR